MKASTRGSKISWAIPPEPFGAVLLEHLLGIELELRRGAGEVPLPDEYLERFPDHRAAVAAAFREQQDTQAQ